MNNLGGPMSIIHISASMRAYFANTVVLLRDNAYDSEKYLFYSKLTGWGNSNDDPDNFI